jgi:molybdate transport system substrate-binding protein
MGLGIPCNMDEVLITRFRRFGQLLIALVTAVFLVNGGTTARAYAGEVLVAVASNFAEVLGTLKIGFEAETNHTLSVTIGSSGNIYAQIINGAPYDIFLSADQARPILLEDGNRIVKSSRFTYAIGKLVLWSANADMIRVDGAATLSAGNFSALAIANPKLAPYGRAARQVLKSLKLWKNVREKIVEGQNIGQTFSFVATTNAQLGFVALSYVMSERNKISGSSWEVPVDLYEPIRQDGVIIARAENNPAAIAFVEYLKSKKARMLISDFGYGLE